MMSPRAARGQEFDQRHEDGEDPNLPQAGQVVFVVQAAKIVQMDFFPHKGLDDADAGRGFADGGIDLGHFGPELPEDVPGPAAEDHGDDENGREHEHGQQGQGGVEVQQDAHDPHQDEGVLEKGHGHGFEHFAQVLDVVGQPGHQPAGVGPVVKGHALFQDVTHEVLPDVVGQPLADVFQEEDLGKIEQVPQDQNQDAEQSHLDQAADVPAPEGQSFPLAELFQIGSADGRDFG